MSFTVVSVTSSELLQNPAMALAMAIDKLGGSLRHVQSGDRFVVLPSVRSARTESPQNTSVRTLRGAVAALQSIGIDVSIGGNPPKALPGPQLVELFNKAGITAVAEELHSPQLLDQRTDVVPLPSGHTAKFFAIARYLTGKVSVVLVPRLRPDDTLMFGSVRGSMSGVPGFKREEVHLAGSQAGRYAQQLVDLTEAIRPILILMETDFEEHAVLVGTSPYAVDMVAVGLLGNDTDRVPTLTAAASRGLGPATVNEVELVRLAA